MNWLYSYDNPFYHYSDAIFVESLYKLVALVLYMEAVCCKLVWYLVYLLMYEGETYSKLASVALLEYFLDMAETEFIQ